MRLLFVTWWPEGHFEHEWHLTEEELQKLAVRGIFVARLAGDVMQPPATLRRLLRRIKFLSDLIRRARNSDLVLGYMDSPSTRAIAIFKRLRILGRTRLVITDFWLSAPVQQGFRQHLKRLFLRHVYGSADMILFDSEKGMLHYQNEGLLGPRPITSYLRCAAMSGKTSWLRSVSQSRSRSRSSDRPYVFAIGKTFREFNTVIAAATEMPDVDFVIMTLEKITCLPSNVRQAPWGSYDDYLDILNNCSAMVIPLRPGVEAAGIRSLYEGWALGIPVVIAANEGISDYLGSPFERAAPYQPGNAASLTSSLRHVLNNPEATALMSDRALRSILEGDLSSSTYNELLFQLIDREFGHARSETPASPQLDSLPGAN